MDMNFWGFLSCFIISYYVFKTFEKIILGICTIIASALNDKHGTLDALLNFADSKKTKKKE